MRLWNAVLVSALGLGWGCGGDASSDGGGSTGTSSQTDTSGDGGDGSGSGGSGADTSDGGTGGSTGDTTTGSSNSSGSTSDPCDCGTGDCPPECWDPLEIEIGYVEIEPVNFTLHRPASSQDFTSSPARLWYGFQPADETPEEKPLAVLYNGGPGAASEILFAFNTSQRSFDEEHNGGNETGPSPASWTSVVNLLYIDARTTGFSYNMMDDPSDAGARSAEFGVQNFNSFLDAADFVRVLLRFLAAHPQLSSNEVILVGESYGGIRTTAMLDLLLDYHAHSGSDSPYEDDALVDEIQAHLDKVFPAQAGALFPPETIAEQFGRQILIQPLLLGGRQLDVAGDLHDLPGSVIFDIAAEVGQTFTPCSQQGGGCDPYQNAINFVEQVAGRDRFAYPFAYDWLFGRIDSLAPKFSTLALATDIFGADPKDVDWLYASERADAYRTPTTFPSIWVPFGQSLDPVPARALLMTSRPSPTFAGDPGTDRVDGDFPSTFGDLEDWDTYYLPSNYVVLNMFYGGTASQYLIDPYSDLFATAFLRNVVYVDTFLTNAAYDLVIWGPSIPETLKQFPAYVANVTTDDAQPANADRPGVVIVEYANGAFGLGPGEKRTIRFPYYDDACHTVPLSQPVEMLADVADWLGQ